jgi:SpoVK/Ycf46/Vps4 family AAA+-type ATPase
MMETETSETSENISYEVLIDHSKKFQQLKKDCVISVKLSLTGITNLVVGYEDPCLVEAFLKSCFKDYELYRGTYDIDAVELQKGSPSRGFATSYLDALIYGSCDEEPDKDGLGIKNPKTDNATGKRKRNPDGFVNRKEVLEGKFKDRTLIIKNLDYCLDFCQNKPGDIDARSLWIFDNFRNPSTKLGCRLLLVSNELLKLPFKVRTVKFDHVDEFEAGHLLNSFINMYRKGKYDIVFSQSQRKQIIRKLCGLTYTEAGDALAESISIRAEVKEGVKEIDSNKVVKNLRSKVNRNLMQDATGLTCLSPRPWQDYICPENSNFTYDVKKILRDFKEIDMLRKKAEEMIKERKDDTIPTKTIQAIRSRMPHVIVLYGKGGLGKSAFPLHFAGLLDFDVWDFNVTATHSKWVGEGPDRMREAITKVSKASHLVVRIDEYDRAIGSTGASGQGMHEAHKQVEAEFMNWLQNSQEENLFVKNDVFLVLTTNHKENITGPLLRSGRADLVIDIAEFDTKSMKETFLSAPRRMENRGVTVVGFNGREEFDKAVLSLDIDRLAAITSQRGFTVRDVDTVLQEMAAHNYYYNRTGEGIPWTTDNFVKVLENSEGSAKGENTSELVLGDRFLLEQTAKEDLQKTFTFFEECNTGFNLEKFMDTSKLFKE